MKRIRIGICLFVLFFICGSSFAQNDESYPFSSGFPSCSSDSSTLDNLKVLCRVWGFVKYHHPVFADTTVDADSELLRLLPRIASAQKEDRNKILLEWITSLGNFQPTRRAYFCTIDSFEWESTVNLKWIRDRRTLGSRLSRTLRDLRYADRDRNRYYPRCTTTASIAFAGEKILTGTAYRNPDCGYRLLTLFRYWNVIEYYFPYKSLTDTPWDRVLDKYLPETIEIKGSDYDRVLYRLVAELRDSHAFVPHHCMGWFWGRWWIPADTWMVGDRMIVVSSGQIASSGFYCFQRGDEILSIDGVTIDSMKRLMWDSFSISNENDLGRFVSKLCWSTAKDTVRVVYRRNHAIRDTVVIPLKNYYPSNKYFVEGRIFPDTLRYKLLNDSIGYIDGGVFTIDYMDEMVAELGHTKGLVVDLRNYPKDDRFMDLEYWLTDTTRTYLLGLMPYYRLPGIFGKFPMRSREIPRERECYRGDVVVLVGSSTQSYAETCVMLLQSIPGVKVIGTQSAGANGNVAYLSLTEGLTFMFSSYGIRYPDGGQTQRIGVRIDEIVEPTIEGIKAGRDEVLERAIEIIENSSKSE